MLWPIEMLLKLRLNWRWPCRTAILGVCEIHLINRRLSTVRVTLDLTWKKITPMLLQDIGLMGSKDEIRREEDRARVDELYSCFLLLLTTSNQTDIQRRRSCSLGRIH